MINGLLHTFGAETGGESAGLFTALGIDWRLLITQALAFLLLVYILGKYVFPHLTRAIDERRESIEQSVQQAKDAQQASEKAEEEVQKALAAARVAADEILARSHSEAASQIAEAEAKAKNRAEQIIKEAHAQLEADVAKARAALKKDTAELVALATERVLHEKVDARKDAQLIDRALQEGRTS